MKALLFGKRETKSFNTNMMCYLSLILIRYRQVDRPSNSENSNNKQNGNIENNPRQQGEETISTHSTTTISSFYTNIRHHEPIDFNWRPVSVPPSAGTTFAIQNLSQDTSYEFYVRAKNIIGEGPRSQIVSATTKRAVTGSFTPISSEYGEVAASTMSGSSGKCQLVYVMVNRNSISLKLL